MPALMSNEHDAPEDYHLMDPPVETETLLLQQHEARTRRPLSRIHLISWAAQSVLFIASLITLRQAFSLKGADARNCVQKHSLFSPALDAIHDDYEVWRFNGTFRNDSPYKGPPSASVDAAWNKITDLGVMSISYDTLKRIGGSEDSIKLPLESGGGYMGALEIVHQLHCVNLLWQATNAEYYKNRSLAWTDRPETLRQHLDHCADLLRQKLMCDGDVGIMTFDWVKNHSRPYPNFNTLHKCRNFDDILEWGKARQAPKIGALKKPADAVELELPP